MDSSETLLRRGEAHRTTVATVDREASESVRDIANADPQWVHPCVNPRRREDCRTSFQLFCETYFPIQFYFNWSRDHIKAIEKIEQSVISGGLFALAMPRGSGKTTLCECAAIWAILYGYRKFVFLVGASEKHSEEMLASIKTGFEMADTLEEDFSEVVGPIRALEGITNRGFAQNYCGELTHIGWKGKEIVMPTMPDGNCCGSIIRVAGLTGRIRGARFTNSQSEIIRPDLVILDDPQTDESARSPARIKKLMGILNGAILNLAGPGKKISGIMPCTVIYPDDMADRILDSNAHPAWQGERTKMVYRFPDNEEHWDQYARLRIESLKEGIGLKLATDYYREHRKEMDEGAQVSWPERFNEDELSAIQNAMNLKLHDEHAFYSEYQNEPMPDEEIDESDLTPDQIAGKLNGYQRGVCGDNTEHLTAFIDVQQKCLYYMVTAWEQEYTGQVIDYGTFPDQKMAYFILKDVRDSLAMRYQGTGLEGSLHAGLNELVNALMVKEWPRSGGGVLRIQRCLIDANWGASTDTVYNFCRGSNYAASLYPSHGRGITAAAVPFSDYKKKKGDKVGFNWRVPNPAGKRAINYVLYDTNFWKTFIYSRLAVAIGDKGNLSLWGNSDSKHRMVADHLVSEYRVRTEGRGRTVDEWKYKPLRQDNHFFDCIVGCAVGASIQGAALPGARKTGPNRERIKLSDIKRKSYGG